MSKLFSTIGFLCAAIAVAFIGSFVSWLIGDASDYPTARFYDLKGEDEFSGKYTAA